jgi:hypothetical protein
MKRPSSLLVILIWLLGSLNVFFNAPACSVVSTFNAAVTWPIWLSAAAINSALGAPTKLTCKDDYYLGLHK